MARIKVIGKSIGDDVNRNRFRSRLRGSGYVITHVYYEQPATGPFIFLDSADGIITTDIASNIIMYDREDSLVLS